MNLYIGGLSRDVTEDDLRKAFEAYGKVSSITIIKDRFTGESRGFGFIEMPSKDEANAAMSGLNATQLKGRSIVVNEARPRAERGGRRDRQGGMGRRKKGSYW